MAALEPIDILRLIKKIEDRGEKRLSSVSLEYVRKFFAMAFPCSSFRPTLVAT